MSFPLRKTSWKKQEQVKLFKKMYLKLVMFASVFLFGKPHRSRTRGTLCLWQMLWHGFESLS